MERRHLRAITVGMTASLTGRYSAQGRQARAGVQAWTEDTNRAGGLGLGDNAKQLPLRFICYDDASQPQRCTELTERLIVADHVDLLLGPYSSDLTRRAVAVAEKHQQVLWNHGGSSDAIFAAGFAWVVGILTPASHYFHGLIDVIRARHASLRRVAIIHSTAGAFPLEVALGAEQHCQEHRVETIVRYPYEPRTIDFSALLRRLSNDQPDVLLGVGRIEDDVRFAAQLVRSNLDVAAVGLIVTPLHLFRTVLGKAADGFLGPSQWEPGVVTTPDYGPSTEEVMQSFRMCYPGEVDYPMAQAYAGCLVAQRCIEVAGTLDQQSLRQTVGELDFSTFYGRFKIDPASGLQIGHVMPVVEWRGGVKAMVWPP